MSHTLYYCPSALRAPRRFFVGQPIMAAAAFQAALCLRLAAMWGGLLQSCGRRPRRPVRATILLIPLREERVLEDPRRPGGLPHDSIRVFLTASKLILQR